MENTGMVYLVGAGPGDPSLMTLKGRALLSACGAWSMTIWHPDGSWNGCPPHAAKSMWASGPGITP